MKEFANIIEDNTMRASAAKRLLPLLNLELTC